MRDAEATGMTTSSRLSDFDVMVAEMVAMGIPPKQAEAAARKDLGLTSPITTGDATIPEKKEQSKIRELWLAYGFKVYNLSQARASKQSPGLGDQWVVHRTKPIAFWWESKRQVGGALSPAQEDFRDECLRCGILHGFGDRFAAEQFLVDLGLATRIGDQIEPMRSLSNDREEEP